MVPVNTNCDADLVSIAGSEAERVPMEEHAALLRQAAERDAACSCTNPDLCKLWNGASVPKADRVVHRAHRLKLKGASLRKRHGGPLTISVIEAK